MIKALMRVMTLIVVDLGSTYPSGRIVKVFVYNLIESNLKYLSKNKPIFVVNNISNKKTMSPELLRNVLTVTMLALAALWPLCNSEHFYGEQLAANLAANGTHLIITISWRLTWNTNKQPNNEKLYTCVSGLGSPCSSGPSYILMEPQTAICTNIVTSIDGFQYVPWTGLDNKVYYPLNKIPANYSTIGMTFIDNDWGLVTAFWNAGQYTGDFGGQLIRHDFSAKGQWRI